MRGQFGTTLLVLGLLAATAAADGKQPLRMQVSPTLARAPAAVTVRVTVRGSTENRVLQIVAASSEFFRSSEVTLDGNSADSLQVFEFRNLPKGLYQITGVLIGTNGPRGSLSRLAKIEAAVGGQ